MIVSLLHLKYYKVSLLMLCLTPEPAGTCSVLFNI